MQPDMKCDGANLYSQAAQNLSCTRLHILLGGHLKLILRKHKQQSVHSGHSSPKKDRIEFDELRIKNSGELNLFIVFLCFDDICYSYIL